MSLIPKLKLNLNSNTVVLNMCSSGQLVYQISEQFSSHIQDFCAVCLLKKFLYNSLNLRDLVKKP